MDRIELVSQLEELAKQDLTDGADIFDHPCTVAIRAINKAFNDIEMLKVGAPKRKGSKAMQVLTGLKYNPLW
jgi:hypothetical protein